MSRSLENRPASLCKGIGLPAWIGIDLIRSLTPLFALFITACASLSGPEYSTPEAPSKQAWSDGLQQTGQGISHIAPDWWRNFQDPELDYLIDKALEQSIDIRILSARIDFARTGVAQADARALPTITGNTAVDHFTHTRAPDTTRYSLAAEANWEIDIWGKIRKGIEAQEADFKATEAEWRAGYLTLVADVASSYFRIRQLDEQSERHAQSLQRSRNILQIYQSMLHEGLIPQTQVLQQQAEIDRLEQERLEFARSRVIAENGLATLVGVPAGSLKIAKAAKRTTTPVPEVPVGLPSQLLARRPDILAAEYRVLQAHHLAGQARLAKLPSLNLTGRAGTAGFTIGDLFDAATFGLASALTFPIFDPNLKAQVRTADAQTQLSEEEYRRTVISAFEDVENTLTNLSNRKSQKLELEARQEKLRIVSEQVKAQLAEGLASQLQVFEVERSLLDSEQQLLTNHWQILSDTVTLYKSLGGGWPSEIVGRTMVEKQ